MLLRPRPVLLVLLLMLVLAQELPAATLPLLHVLTVVLMLATAVLAALPAALPVHTARLLLTHVQPVLALLVMRSRHYVAIALSRNTNPCDM